MNDYTRDLYEKVVKIIPTDRWEEIVRNRPVKSVDSQGEYVILKAPPMRSYGNEGEILQKELRKRYIPYHFEVGFPSEIVFTPLKLKISINNLKDLDLFSFGNNDYFNTLGILCFEKVPLPVIIEYAKIMGI